MEIACWQPKRKNVSERCSLQRQQQAVSVPHNSAVAAALVDIHRKRAQNGMRCLTQRVFVYTIMLDDYDLIAYAKTNSRKQHGSRPVMYYTNI